MVVIDVFTELPIYIYPSVNDLPISISPLYPASIAIAPNDADKFPIIIVEPDALLPILIEVELLAKLI
jgi:hypothetical protein